MPARFLTIATIIFALTTAVYAVPTTPVIQVDSTTFSTAELHASLTSSDAETGIVEYRYAIGTTPTDPGSGYIVEGVYGVPPPPPSGGRYIAEGLYLDPIVSVTEYLDVPLRAGQTYYWYVRAKNALDEWSDVGVSSGTLVKALKAGADGVSCHVNGLVVTAVFPDCVYVENPERAWGIAIPWRSADFSPGDVVEAYGYLSTSETGERLLDAQELYGYPSETALKPLGLTNNALGGGDWCYDQGTGVGQRGVKDGEGLNNLGLLVTTTGQVTLAGQGWFYINDGSGVSDGSGNVGVYVVAGALPVPQKDSYVAVTGISSCDLYMGNVVSTLRATNIWQPGITPPPASPVTARATLGLDGTSPAVLVSWERGSFPIPGINITKYNIYRDNNAVPVWSVAAGTGLSSYLDTTMTPCVKHQYYVAAEYVATTAGTDGSLATGETPWQPAIGFATPIAQMSIYDLTVPMQGWSQNLRKVTFQWRSQLAADTYVVEVSTSPLFTQPEFISTPVLCSPQAPGSIVELTVNETLYTLFKTVPGTQPIFWRVGAKASEDVPGPVPDRPGRPSSTYIYSEVNSFRPLTYF